MRDNRNYVWDDEEVSIRSEYLHIERWIPDGVKVIDLGCGNGSLLKILKEKKNIFESGIEISESGVVICKKKGLNVRQGRIDVKLNDIPDDVLNTDDSLISRDLERDLALATSISSSLRVLVFNSPSSAKLETSSSSVVTGLSIIEDGIIIPLIA